MSKKNLISPYWRVSYIHPKESTWLILNRKIIYKRCLKSILRSKSSIFNNFVMNALNSCSYFDMYIFFFSKNTNFCLWLRTSYTELNLWLKFLRICFYFLKVQTCKLHNNKYMIASTQITNTEFVFKAFLDFKLLRRKVLFINRKDNRDC